MQVIIPVAGYGSRMRPHTHSRAKPLFHVAGKPCIDYILDEIQELDFVSEVIFITGHLKEQIEDHLKKNYKFKMRFIEQTEINGTAGAIQLAEPYIKEDLLVVFADTIFDIDLNVIKTQKADGIIWGRLVEDYSRFGIMMTDKDGFLTGLIEKPNKPYTRLANIGMYYVKNYKMLFELIDVLLKTKQKGEYHLPPLYGEMAKKGEKIKILETEGWYDTGKPETTFESQKILLEKRHKVGKTKNTKIVGNVYIEDGAVVEDCTIGPDVSIGEGSVVKNCKIKNSIIGINSEVSDSTLEESLVGDEAIVKGVSGKVNVGDHSEVTHESNT